MQLSLWGQHFSPSQIMLVVDKMNSFNDNIDTDMCSILADKESILLAVHDDVRRINITTGKVISTHPGLPHMIGRIRHLSASRGGDRYVTLSRHGHKGKEDNHDVLRCCRTDTGEAIQTLQLPKINSIACDQDLRWVIIHSYHDCLASVAGNFTWPHGYWIWNTMTGKLNAMQSHDFDVEKSKFDPTGNYVVSPFENDGMKGYKIHHCPTGESTGRIMTSFPHSHQQHTFSPDGREWMDVEVIGDTPNGDVACHVRRWELATGTEIGTDLRFEGSGPSLQFSPDGRWLIAWGQKNAADKQDIRPVLTYKSWEWPTLRAWPYTDLSPLHVCSLNNTAIRNGWWLTDWPATKVICPLPYREYEAYNYSYLNDIIIQNDNPFSESRSPETVRCLCPWTGRYLGPPLATQFTNPSNSSPPHRPLTVRWPLYSVITKTGQGRSGEKEYIDVIHWCLQPAVGSPDQITLWIQTLTSKALNARGEVRPLTPAELADRKRRLDSLGGSPLPPRPPSVGEPRPPYNRV